MAQKKGQGKTPGSGRKKGTPNKKTLAVAEAFAAAKLDPVRMLANALKKAPYDIKVKAALALMEFIYPKRKAVEITDDSPADEGTSVVVNLTTEALLRVAEENRGK